MKEQPEALRLADAVDSFNRGVRSQIMYEEYSAAARELRRLHERDAKADAQIKELLQVIEDFEHHTELLQQRVQGLGEIVRNHSKRVIELEKYVQELERYKNALEEWQEKTEWVQSTARVKELGMHRADVLKLRIKELESKRESLSETHVSGLAEQAGFAVTGPA